MEREVGTMGLLVGTIAAPPACPACEESGHLAYDGPRDAYLCRCGCAVSGQVASQTGLRLALRAGLERR